MFEILYFKFLNYAAPVFLVSTLHRFKKSLSVLMTPYVVLLYLIGMSRTAGVDLENYRSHYMDDGVVISDPAYNAIAHASLSFGLPFEIFLLVIGCINLIILYKVTRYFEVNFGLVLFIYLLHLAVVRDFSQMRIGLACFIILYGFTLSSQLRWVLYLIGIGTHLTSAYLIFAIYTSLYFDGKSNIFSRRFIIGCIFLISLALNVKMLSFLDPRIDIYLNWQQKGYGESVTSVTQIFFASMIMCWIYTTISDTDHKVFFIRTCIISILTFIAFSQYAIFASRLSNIALSFYPIAIAMGLRQSNDGVVKIIFAAIFIVITSSRSNTPDIIRAIQHSY